MPSSSLVELEVEVGVEVGIEGGVGVEVGVEVDATVSFRHNLDSVQIFFRLGWGWLKKWGLKLISTQVVVEVEVGVELGKNALNRPKLILKSTCFSP